jgi:hypothetical protein
MFVAASAQAATTKYWIGHGGYPSRPGVPAAGICYGFMDDDACWSQSSGGAANTTAPTSTEDARFDSHGAGDCTVSPLASGLETVNSITTVAGFTGNLNIVDQGGVNPDFSTVAGVTMAAGTISVQGAQISIGGAILINSGTFNADTVGSGTLGVTGATTVRGESATFNGGTGTTTFTGGVTVDTSGTMNAGTGTLKFSGILTVGGGTGNLGTFKANAATVNLNSVAGTTTVRNGSTFHAGTSKITTVGSLSVTTATFYAESGDVTIGTTTGISTTATFDTTTGRVGSTLRFGGTFTATSSTVDFYGAASTTFAALTVSTGASVTMGPAATLTTLVVRGASALLTASANSFTTTLNSNIDQGGRFDAVSGAKTFAGTFTVGAAATTGTFNPGTASLSFVNLRVIDAAVDFTGAMSTSFTGTVTVNASGTLTMGPSVTIPRLSVAGASAVFNASATMLTVSGATNVDTGGTFRANGGTIGFSSTVTVGTNGAPQTAGTFSAGTASLTFSNSLTVSDATVDFTGAMSTSFAAVTLNPNGVVTMGPSASLSGNLSVSGASSVFNASANALTISGSTNINTGGVFHANGCSNLQMSSALLGVTVGSGGGAGTFYADSATITFNGNAGNSLLVQSSSTFDGGTASLTFGAGTTTNTNNALNLSSGTVDLTNTISTQFSPTGGVGNINVSVGTTLTLGANSSAFPHNLTVSGTLNARGTVSVANTTSVNNALADFEGQTAGITFTGAVTNSAGKLYLASAGLTFSNALTVSGGTTTLGSQMVTFTALTVNTSGQLKVGSANVTVSGAVNVSSGSADFSSTTTGPTFQSSVTVSGGSLTLGSGTVGITTSLSVSGGSLNCNAADVTVTSTTGVSGGTGVLNAGSNKLTLNGTLTLGTGGGAPTSGSFAAATATISAKALTIESGSTFDGGSGSNNITFTGLTLGNATGSASTLNAGQRTGTVTFSAASTINQASTFDAQTTGSVSFGGTLTLGNATPTTGIFKANAAKITFSGTVTVVSGSSFDGGTSPLLTFNPSAGSALVVGNATTSGTFSTSAAKATVNGSVQILGSSTFSGGTSSALSFNGAVTIGTTGGGATPGFFDAGSAISVSFAAFTLQNASSTFNGDLATGVFTSAPTLTSGTFTVAAAGSTGRWTLQASTTFTNGVTLAFPSDKGQLSLTQGKVLTIQGPITSNVGTSSTLPKIDCNGCTSGQSITFLINGTSALLPAVLNVNGLELDNSAAAGVTLGSNVTYTLFKRLKFQNNAGGGTSTHLAITMGTGLIEVPGCYFDATAAHNVTLSGTGMGVTARAIFENQSLAVNGPLAGDAYDQDADGDHNNVADSSASPRWGSVIEWVGAVATDTSGTAVGYPTAAFDWNTFQWYGVYVAYRDTSAGTNDTLWLRNEDGTAAYSYTVPQTSGDIVGTPWWDTINETTAGLDANGDGDQTDTDVRIVYIGTSTGHIIKLVDNGSSLAAPASGPWSTDFANAGVATITSPLIEDGTNLYFGGTDGSAAPSMFAVQIVAGGSGEKALARTVSTLNAVTATPSWAVNSGKTYVFLGSAASAGTAYVYRVNMTTGATTGSFSGATTSINASVRLINNHAYAVTDGGTMHVLDASNFNSGGFVNISGFPYQSAAASPIKAAPYIDHQTSYAYFGDNSGKLYVVTDTGANLTNYPFSITGSPQLTSSPVYLPGTGVIALGAADGCIYFVDRRNTLNAPGLIKKYFVTGSATISSVGYDYNTSRYMVSSSDGKLMFINASDVPDPTNGVE